MAKRSGSELEFPVIPASVLSSGIHFEPAPEVRRWAEEMFITGDVPQYYNEDHQHLLEAKILFVWASYGAKEKGKILAGQAEVPQGQVAKWSQGRSTELIQSWARRESWDPQDNWPDFLITLNAPWFYDADIVSRCAVIEHELYHCGQEMTEYGMPVLRNGSPVWCTRAHDIEEFAGVVRRYGAWNGQLAEFGDALNRPPRFKRGELEAYCGCGARI